MPSEGYSVPFKRSPIPAVLRQYLGAAVAQRERRSVLVHAPHVQPHRLRRLDDQLLANLDGLATAGVGAQPLCLAALQDPGRGAAFVNAVAAIEGRDLALLERLLAAAEAVPEACAGLISAFGWVSAASLHGITRALLDSADPFRRGIGLRACSMHRVDPAGELDAMIDDSATRRSAIIVAGRLGRTDMLPACLQGLAQDDAAQRFEAARAALLLGDREDTVRALVDLVAAAGPYRVDALVLVLKVLPSAQVEALLRPLVQDPQAIRVLVRALGVTGDPRHIPWLINRMSEPTHARIAGESFSMITGVDMTWVDLEQSGPVLQLGPTDDPDDDDVAMDEDEGLPWPDAEKVAAWWKANRHRFKEGTRYFMGEPPSVAHCRRILREGFQRQRVAAAEWLCLLQPGTPLFNTAAPAWRQQRWLTQMGA